MIFAKVQKEQTKKFEALIQGFSFKREQECLEGGTEPWAKRYTMVYYEIECDYSAEAFNKSLKRHGLTGYAVKID